MMRCMELQAGDPPQVFFHQRPHSNQGEPARHPTAGEQRSF